jgi:hypothetical protein
MSRFNSIITYSNQKLCLKVVKVDLRTGTSTERNGISLETIHWNTLTYGDQPLRKKLQDELIIYKFGMEIYSAY